MPIQPVLLECFVEGGAMRLFGIGERAIYVEDERLELHG
jgi:hypothetical protein